MQSPRSGAFFAVYFFGTKKLQAEKHREANFERATPPNRQPLKNILYTAGIAALALPTAAVEAGFQPSATSDTVLVSEIRRSEGVEKRFSYGEWMAQHPYECWKMAPNFLKNYPKQDRPDLAGLQDAQRTMDPLLGRPAPERLAAAQAVQEAYRVQMEQANGEALPGDANNRWLERGPSNVGGRTRALAWDPASVAAGGYKLWAGGVTGGLWVHPDIRDPQLPWQSVGSAWANLSISAIAFDPQDANTVYVGTGEGWFAGSSRGAGIWKSTDGGATWAQLPTTSNYYYINDLVVRVEGGVSVVYAAVDIVFYVGVANGPSGWPSNWQDHGLYRSVNGGSSWTKLALPSNSQAVADLEIGPDGTLWAGTRRSPSSVTNGAQILKSTNGTTWTLSYTVSPAVVSGRVELAVGGTAQQPQVYALYENNSKAGGFLRSSNNGTTWNAGVLPVDADTDIGADFTRGQAWYDLIIGVDPNDPQVVYAGGINWFRSTDGGSSWTQISKWSNNNQLAQLNVSTVHADQHALVFYPGSSSTAVLGNDGGVYFTQQLPQSGQNPAALEERNRDYNVTQFYSVALHPGANVQQFLGGTQDNGTPRFTSHGVNTTTDVIGGDGAYCFIDETDGQLQVGSYVFNTYLQSLDQGVTFDWNDVLLQDYTTVDFINPAAYDSQGNRLFSSRTANTLYRISGVGTANRTVQTLTVTGMSAYASHLSVSPFSPAGTTTLYLGTKNGAVLRIPNAHTGTSVTATVLSNGLPTTGSISSISFGASENDLVVTYFNYGITSVWRTTNGGASWTSVEGNLPDMPVRWALRHPDDPTQVILATELGIWATTDLTAQPVVWTPSLNGFERVRVDMLRMRTSDRLVAAATYGRGVFTSSVFAPRATWVGAVSTSASDPLNWQPEVVPGPQTDVLVPANALRSMRVDLRLEGADWEVESGARVDLSPGAALDLTSLTNEGTLLLEANSTGYAQLRTTSYTGAGNFTVQRYAAAEGYHPVAFADAAAINRLGTVGADAGAGIQNTFTWNAQTSQWTSVPNGLETTVPGQGYLAYVGTDGVQASAPTTWSLTGAPTSSVSVSLAYDLGNQSNASSFAGQGASAQAGWNFLGNSFSCALDFESFSRTNVARAFYVFDPTLGGVGGYRAHSPGGIGLSSSAVIPPMTGFWVQTTAPGASLHSGNSLTPASHGRTLPRPFANKGNRDRVAVRVSEWAQPQRTDEAILTFHPDLSNPATALDYLPEFDAREWLHGTGLPNLAYRKGNEYFTHKELPFGPAAQAPLVVPAFFRASASNINTSNPVLYRMFLDTVWSTSNYGVYLQDLALNALHPLHQSPYVFTDNGDSTRFQWIITRPGPTLSDAGFTSAPSQNTNALHAALQPLLWKDSDGTVVLQINVPNGSAATALLSAPKIYDLTGRHLANFTRESEFESTGASQTTSPTQPTPQAQPTSRWTTRGIQLPAGVHLVYLETSQGTVVLKMW
jgi:hypothetical protein